MTAPSNASEPTEPTDGQSQDTGLPALHSWRAVYIFVGGICVFYIVLLAILTKVYQ